MKKRGISVAIAAIALGSAGVSAQAQPLPGYYDARAHYYGRAVPPPAYDPGIPPYEIAGILRSTGFLPLGGPVRRGGVYTVSAVHANGDEGRVVIDAYSGRFVRFVPAWQLNRRSRNDEMVLVYQGPNFPPPDVVRPRVINVPPPVSAAPRSPVQLPRMASRTPPASTPTVTPKPRPAAAPQKPQTVQAPPTPAPVQTRPATVSPPLVSKPVEAKPSVVQPTQPLPPVQTME